MIFQPNLFLIFISSILIQVNCAEQPLPSDVPFSDRKTTERNEQRSTTEIYTTLGSATGTIERSDILDLTSQYSGRTYYAFRGIPYAKPPMGPLRFSDPVKVEKQPWKNEHIDATKFQNFCPQYDYTEKKVVGSEDCLYMNIYTPIIPDMNKRAALPVLVYIHGGAYTRGSAASHGPSKLMREDIVIVTVAYRLGIFGLLSSGDSELPGNYAALDQVVALQWIRSHISEFGGKPDDITLGGFSAGASYVHMHLLSPLSDGLFQKAIISSGSANCLWSVQEDPWSVAKEIAYSLGCSTMSSAALKQCLLLKNTESLIQAQTNQTRYVYWPFMFAPVVDKSSRETPFLPAPIENLHVDAKKIPVLLGGTPDEGLLFALTVMLYSEYPTSARSVFEETSNYIFESLWSNKSSASHISNAIKSFYYSENARKNLDTFIFETTDALTDLFFTSCIWDAGKHLSSFHSPTYAYLMDYHDSDSISFASSLYRQAVESTGINLEQIRKRISHGDDLALYFDFPNDMGEMTSRDQHMSFILCSMIGSFVKYGSPQADGSYLAQFEPWIPIQPGGPTNYYTVSFDPTMNLKPFKHKEQNFWQQTLAMSEMQLKKTHEGWLYKIGFWLLLSIFIAVLISVLILLYVVCLSKRSQSYPTDNGILLKSQKRQKL